MHSISLGRMIRTLVAVMTMLIVGRGVLAEHQAGFPGVLPKPKEYRETGRPIRLAKPGETIRVHVFGENPALKTGVRDLADRLQALGGIKVETGDQGARIRIEASDKPGGTPDSLPVAPTQPEGYGLAVHLSSDGTLHEVVIRGRDGIGGYYGIQTLIQLLDRSPEGVTVRQAAIRDWPTFSYRLFKGQCWYYRDNRMFVDWAPRFKWNVFGSCYTDSPDWRSPSETYRKMIAGLCDTAAGTGAIRVIQLGNPFMIKEKAIRATADGDVETLAAFFEPSLSHGSKGLMLCLDDFAYLPKEDAAKFKNLAGANASVATRFAERIWAKHPGTYIMLCPPPYWLNANKHKNYEWAHEYLRDFCAAIPKEISIVWTGVEVTTPCHDAADIKAYQALCGPERRLFLWDNTLKLPPGWSNVFRMNAFLETCKDIADSAWPSMATFTHGEAGINTYGPGEIYKVPLMTAADYLWNPEGYAPHDSMRRALYWFDDNHAVGPMLHHWVDDLHQKLFTQRLEFLKAPSQQGLDEMKSLVAEYQGEFDRIAAATKNKELVATMRPYLRRHTESLGILADVLTAWDARQSDPAAAGKMLEAAKEAFAKFNQGLEKGDIAGDNRGVVLPELEKATIKAIDTLGPKISAKPTPGSPAE